MSRNTIPITEFFNQLDAPLRNRMWSWGALTTLKNEVVLRVWWDERKVLDDKFYFRLTMHSLFDGLDARRTMGFRERLEHIQIAQSKGRAFFVYVIPDNSTVQPRTISGYHEDLIGFSEKFVVDDAGDYWGEETRIIRPTQYHALKNSFP